MTILLLPLSILLSIILLFLKVGQPERGVRAPALNLSHQAISPTIYLPTPTFLFDFGSWLTVALSPILFPVILLRYFSVYNIHTNPSNILASQFLGFLSSYALVLPTSAHHSMAIPRTLSVPDCSPSIHLISCLSLCDHHLLSFQCTHLVPQPHQGSEHPSLLLLLTLLISSISF